MCRRSGELIQRQRWNTIEAEGLRAVEAAQRRTRKSLEMCNRSDELIRQLQELLNQPKNLH
jgi:hypothetical protein